MEQPPQSAEAYRYDDKGFMKPAWSSSECIVPLLVSLFEPRSVIDVGCGMGIWLAAFEKAGVAELLGVDGAWVRPEHRVIPEVRFMAVDLNAPETIRVQIPRRFDLVMCMEVAEHLPAHVAEPLIDALAALGDLICFSSAVPGQGGYQHINEQWQSYWAQKFLQRGFQPFDIIRPLIAHEANVAYYYRQNIVIYAGPGQAARCGQIAAKIFAEPTSPQSLDYVLPCLFTSRTDPRNFSVRGIAKVLPHLVSRSLRSVAARLFAPS